MSAIIHATSPADYQQVRQLFLRYAESLGVSLCFQGFDEELATLPGKYAPPDGCLLLAEHESRFVGCVGLRKLGDGIGEMKRLYVEPAARGLGLGRQLVEAIIREARSRGYAFLRLDTLPSMQEAQVLYRATGFREIAAYCHNPCAEATYMELRLKPAD